VHGVDFTVLLWCMVLIFTAIVVVHGVDFTVLLSCIVLIFTAIFVAVQGVDFYRNCCCAGY
jgi:hypothetical protein